MVGMVLVLRLFVGSLLLAMPGYPVYAQDAAGGQSGQGGPWPGKGVSVGLGYKLDLLRGSGGMDNAAGAMGNLDFKMRADLDEIWGWKNSIAYLQIINDHGGKLNANHTGSLMGVSNIEVPVNTTKIFHAWLQRNYLDDHLSLLAGLYPVDAEFSVMDSAGFFLHPALGAPADFALTRGPSIFNTSAVGLRVRWDAPERDYYGMAALLDGMPGDPGDAHGTHIRFDTGDGAFLIAEFGVTPPEKDYLFGPAVQVPEIRLHEKYESFGKYAVGFWAYTTKVDDLIDTDSVGNPVRRVSRGGYLLAEKTLLREPGSPTRHLAGFFRLSFNDANSTSIRYAVNMGLRLRAPLREREDDIVGIAYTYARLGDKYRDAQNLAGYATAKAEEALELTYRIQFREEMALQPVFQYIRHPGGDLAPETATVIGARLELVF